MNDDHDHSDARRTGPDLVIFDCDGVLVDTERVANTLLTEALATLGIELAFEETVARFKGRSARDCCAIIERDFAVAVDPTFYDACRARLLDRFEAAPRTLPGITEALDTIDRPVCVASSGEHEKMRRTLGATGLLERFAGRIFSASEVPRSKPFPDLFLHAARAMGAEPARCVVVEDSVPGVEAGVAAGMPVLGYVDLTGEEALAAAGARCFHDMRDLPALLSTI